MNNIKPLELDKILYNESPLVINPTLAKLIGLNKAIILQQLHYWLVKNQQDEKNYYDEHYWSYNSLEEWKNQNFPFWSIATIKRTLKALEKDKLIKTGNYNKTKMDKTKWYTIDYDEFVNMIHPSGQIDPIIRSNCTHRQVKLTSSPYLLSKSSENITENTSENKEASLCSALSGNKDLNTSKSIPRRNLQIENSTQNVAPPVQSAARGWCAVGDIMAAYQAEMATKYPNSPPLNDFGKEYKLMKKLLERYGDRDRVIRFIKYIFAHWDDLRRYWKVEGAPTIEVIWKFGKGLIVEIDREFSEKRDDGVIVLQSRKEKNQPEPEIVL